MAETRAISRQRQDKEHRYQQVNIPVLFFSSGVIIIFYSFNIRRIKNLTANPLKYRPAVNQVELNFWNPQPELVKVR